MYFSKSATAAALLGALWLAGCGEKPKEKKAEAGPAVAVTLGKATEQQVADEYEATGSVRARTTSVLAARVMGYIRELRPQAGQMVQAGEVVAVIDAKEIETGVRQAEAARSEARSAIPEADNAIAAAKAQLDLASATFKRMQSLFEQKSITSQELDEVTAKRNLAQAGYEMARARRQQLNEKIRQADEGVAQAGVMQGYTQLKAPFTGVVVERKAEPGMLAAPGMPLLVLEQAGSYRLEVGIEEARLASVRQGMPARLKLDALDKPIDSRVEEIVPAMDAGSRSFTAKLGLPAASLIRSGMFGRARFSFGQRPALLVPAAAISAQGQVQRVFVVEGGVARARLVKTGAASGDSVEVLSGLNDGESVVAPVPAMLADGAKVEVRK